MQLPPESKRAFFKTVHRYGAAYIAAWSALITMLACGTVHFHHLDIIKEAENEARDYFILNQFYRAWSARLGGVYAPADKVVPNPYLAAPRRDVSTADGQRLTLVNPAYMTRMVFESIRKASQTPVVSKLTSLKPLNPVNVADSWEKESLGAFARGECTERSQITSLNGKPYLRYIARFVTEQACLACHARQGYRLGDVRGGITISIPMAGYYASEAKSRSSLLAGYLMIWLAGSFGIAATSRRRGIFEDNLRAGEVKFRTICDWTQDWEYWTDPEGILKYVSPSCEELTGYPPDAFVTDPGLLGRLVHPEDRSAFREHLALALPEGHLLPGSLEFRIIARDGTLRWIHHACRPVYSDGCYRGRRVSNRDVTVQKRNERELAIRAELLNCVSDSVLVIGKSGRILDANETAWRSRGYSREEFLSLSIGELSCSPAIPVSERLELIFADGSAFFESEHRLKDGGVIVVEVSASVIDYRGEPANLSSIRDITERKRIEASLLQARLEQQQATAALQENERKLRVIFDVMQAGIIQVDAAGTVSFANGRMAEMLGLPMAQLIGSPYGNYVCEDQGAAADTSLQRLLAGETDNIHCERHYLRRDGSDFWGYLTGRRLWSPDGKLFSLVGTISDMTELKTAEAKRNRVEQQMLHVQKLESLGVLAGGIAHDFNNILLAIMGNASLALHRLPADSAAEHHLQQIKLAADKAADLARQMLAYSGKGHFVLEALDLNQLVREMTAMLEVSISKKAQLHFHLAPQLPAIVADPTQMRQILMNLAINASEAIGENSGVISIATGCLECERGFLADSWLNDDLPKGLYDFLEVTDTGCGMDPETVGRIFEPFFSTKFTGRGLGMAAILGIVRGHRGAIKVYSEPGQGSAFRIYLPASDQAVQSCQAEGAGDGWRGEGTVLLVDDEETVRQVGTDMLEELGFTVLCASDGREALQLYRDRRQEIALVLMDLTMPNLNGEEAFSELCRIDPQVRVVLSSGFSEQEVTGKFQGKGLAGFVQKPYSLATLRDLLSGLLCPG